MGIIQPNVTLGNAHNLAADYADTRKILSSAYEAFTKQTMVLYASASLSIMGIDSKTAICCRSTDIAASSCSVSDSFRHKIGPIIIAVSMIIQRSRNCIQPVTFRMKFSSALAMSPCAGMPEPAFATGIRSATGGTTPDINLFY